MDFWDVEGGKGGEYMLNKKNRQGGKNAPALENILLTLLQRVVTQPKFGRFPVSSQAQAHKNLQKQSIVCSYFSIWYISVNRRLFGVQNVNLLYYGM